MVNRLEYRISVGFIP